MLLLLGAALGARFWDARWYLRRRTALIVMLRVAFSLGGALLLLHSASGRLAAPFVHARQSRLSGPVYAVCVATRICLMRVDFKSALLLHALDCLAMGTAFRISGWPLAAASTAPPGIFWATMITLYLAGPSFFASALDAWHDRRLAAAHAREAAAAQAAAAAAAAARAAEDAALKRAARAAEDAALKGAAPASASSRDSAAGSEHGRPTAVGGSEHGRPTAVGATAGAGAPAAAERAEMSAVAERAERAA
jgi:hypothetical protein